MTYTLYNIAIRVYHYIFLLASIFNKKAHKILKGRAESKILVSRISSNGKKVLWFHCASLGEWEQTIPIVRRLRANEDYFMLLSFYSPSGFENAKDKELVDIIIYLPEDFSASYDYVFNAYDIAALILTRYDIWPNQIRLCNKKNIPVFLIGAEFTDESRFLKKNNFFGVMLSTFRYIFTNDQKSLDLLNNAGFQNVICSGSPKIERAINNTNQPMRLAKVAEWKNESKVLIVGSSWNQEIRIIYEFWKKNTNLDLKLIIVPHEPTSAVLKEIESYFNGEAVRLSSQDLNKNNSKILLVDSVGQLSSLYRLAELALVGGGFGKGIHNILEPSSYGIPVVSGPNCKKFSEAKLLLEAGIYFTVNNSAQFISLAEHLLLPDSAEQVKKKATIFYNEQKGASNLISEKIVKIIKSDIRQI